MMFKRAKVRAKEKGIDFNLEPHDITIPSHCPIFGFPFDKKTAHSDASPSLDRIHNNIGYVKGNVVVVSNRANRLKSDATLPELQRIIDFYSDFD